jgi:hypothetical protein
LFRGSIIEFVEDVEALLEDPGLCVREIFHLKNDGEDVLAVLLKQLANGVVLALWVNDFDSCFPVDSAIENTFGGLAFKGQPSEECGEIGLRLIGVTDEQFDAVET